MSSIFVGVLTLDILDTSGSYEFPAMRQLAIKSADAFILVFSVDDSESFEEVRRLRELILEQKSSDNNESQPLIPIVVVGNKTDLEDKRVIKKVLMLITICDSNDSYDWCLRASHNQVIAFHCPTGSQSQSLSSIQVDLASKKSHWILRKYYYKAIGIFRPMLSLKWKSWIYCICFQSWDHFSNEKGFHCYEWVLNIITNGLSLCPSIPTVVPQITIV